jgi:beta-lactamase superfamily II metal-dependent hydrolase
MTALLAALCVLVAPVQDSTLLITFLDVGQGDAVVIEAPEGQIALVDGGPRDDDVAAWLRDMEFDTIGLVVASHGHADHIAGLAAILRAFDVRAYLDNGVPHTSQLYGDLMSAVEESGAAYLEATARRITLGGVTLRVLPPAPAGGGDPQNRASVGIVVEFGAFRALLAGDADAEALDHFLELGVPAVDVLKAAHHGSNNGDTPEWLAATRPRVVVITVGAGNRYGHPGAEALRRYAAAGAEVFRTDEIGDIIIEAWPDGAFVVMGPDNEVLAEFAPRAVR